MDVPRQHSVTSPRPAIVVGALAFIAYAAALELYYVAFLLAPGASPVATFFPLAGLTFVLFLRTPPARWPVLFGAIWLAELSIDLLNGTSVRDGAVWGVANAVEPMVAVLLVRRLAGRDDRYDLGSLHHLLIFVGSAVLAGPCIGALIASVTAPAGGAADVVGAGPTRRCTRPRSSGRTARCPDLPPRAEGPAASRRRGPLSTCVPKPVTVIGCAPAVALSDASRARQLSSRLPSPLTSPELLAVEPHPKSARARSITVPVHGYWTSTMRPIPETVEALDELDACLDEGTLLDQMHRTAALAQGVVPDLVGFSIAAHQHGITFTVVATDDEIAALDAVQYLTHGPCVDAFAEKCGVATSSAELFNEPRWQEFAQATAAAGVRSTVTFPIVENGRVTGTVNVYGRHDDTFEGKHQLLATVFSAWAPGAVTNADLAFSTRRTAEQAPAHLRQHALVDTATGILAASRGVTLDAARHDLEDSAARAGIAVPTLARMILELHSGDGTDPLL